MSCTGSCSCRRTTGFLRRLGVGGDAGAIELDPQPARFGRVALRSLASPPAAAAG
jgi:hypothetical protein